METIWYCELIQKALEKDIPVMLFDANEQGMGLQIGTIKFDGFGWEAFEDTVYAEDIPKAKRLLELFEENASNCKEK